MNIAEILMTKYPDEWLKGKMGFKDENDGNGIVISHWDMDIPQPTISEIMALQTDMQPAFNLIKLKEKIIESVSEFIEYKAKEKGYDSASSCISYVNSTVTEWQNEATAFIAWRDNVWQYCLLEFIKVQDGLRELSSGDNFVEELPELVWP